MTCVLAMGLYAQSDTRNSSQNDFPEKTTHVTVAEALEVGYSFMRTCSHERGNASANGNVSKQAMQLVYTGTATDGSDCYYVFSLQPRGFVIVAADERAEPILGYSYDNPFSLDGMPENGRYWLDQYGQQIKMAVDNGELPSTEIAERWSLLKSGQAMPSRSVTAVSPLIQTTWNQDNYYNLLCPADASGPGGHVYAGCVATALAQIIRYWQWPNQGFNSHSYDHSTYGTLSVDFNSATYNYNNMPNSLSSSSTSTQKNAVAKLIYHCGVAVDMDYSTIGSSAFFFPVPSVLYNYFAFEDNGTYVYKSDYSDSDWANLLKQELNNARPVFYSGQGSGGHAFVCDGYDNSGNFHFNWGWGGYNDGYFALNALTPGSYNYSQDQEAIIGISATGSFIRCSTSQMVLNTYDGVESSAQTLSVRGHSLSGNISVTAGNGFQISTNGINYSTSATLASTGGTLYVKYIPTSSNNAEYTMTLTSGSCSANVTLYGSSSTEPCIAPKNLTGTRNGSSVDLSWNVPVTYNSSSPNSVVISWGSSSNISSYYGYGVASQCMVQRFETSDLTPYNQYLLKAVWFIGSPYATSYKVVVFKGGSCNNGSLNSGEQVVNQVVPLSTVNTTGWTVVTLTNPVLVDATSELWFGVVATGDYVIPYVEGEAISNKGNIIGLTFEEGATEFSWYGNLYPSNIPLGGTLEKISAQVLQYDVYRQNTLIGSTTNTTYTDNNPLNSSCTYTVSAVWNNNCSESATVTVSAPTIIPPTVTTANVTNIGTNSASCGGNVTNDGYSTVTARGICWSTSQSPTISDSHTSDGSGTGAFTSNITDLESGFTYYVRAYATNSAGTAYGNEVSFTTFSCPDITLPYLETFESFTQSTTTATGVEPDCWELVRTDATSMPDDKRPQLCYNSSFAHSGSYSLKMSNRCVYAMPELAEDVQVNKLRLDMFLRQANARYRLEVGVWDGQTFVPVATFDNGSTNVLAVSCDFSSYTGNGRRIAFRNSLNDGSNLAYSTNYLDDITLSLQLCEKITPPYTEDFDSFTQSTATATGVEPDCWELVRTDASSMPSDKRPQLCYNSSFAHSGSYSLKMSNRCVYAMPELAEDVQVNKLRLDMYLRQANARYRLEVGVWDGQTFVPVATFDNGTTDVLAVSCNFSSYTGNGRRIAFRNSLNDGSNLAYSTNYLDDITLSPQLCEKITPPYTEDFDSFTQSTATATGVEPDCWELVRVDAPSMPDDKLPQIYYNSGFAHSGSYSLKLYNRGVYAMPELGDETSIRQLKLDMYLRQANAKYQLQVGVWDGQTFVPVATFNNSTTEVEHVTCDFSNYTGNGRRIAFRNTLGSGSYAYSVNYLDDITLTEMVDCSISTIPYTETFEDYTESTTAATGVEPDCWELVREDAAITDATRPQIYYNGNFAHSGDYTLKMGNRCVYAMPKMSPNVPMNQISLDMYLRQPNAAYRLEVGVWNDATNTFTPIALFNNTTTGVEHVTCDFSNYTGNGRRIAFRNTLSSGKTWSYSYNYIDDINLTFVTNKSAEVTNANTTDAGMLGADRDMVDILVYPNPTKDYINVQCTMNNVQCSGIEVIDIYGKVVRTVVGANNDSPTQINVSGLAAGMYFVRVTTEEGTVTKAFVKR